MSFCRRSTRSGAGLLLVAAALTVGLAAGVDAGRHKHEHFKHMLQANTALVKHNQKQFIAHTMKGKDRNLAIALHMAGHEVTHETLAKAKTKGFWWTNSAYKFPYWSSTGAKHGDALGKGTGLCFLGVVPWAQMQKNLGVATFFGALKDKFGLDECDNDEQCADHKDCHNYAGFGMPTKPLCYIARGDNACACGILAQHILRKEDCAPANMYPPSAFTHHSEKKTMEKRLQEVMQSQQKITETGKQGGAPTWLVGHWFPVLQDWFSSWKRMPTWVDSENNGQYCITAWLPYVRCTRTAWSTVKDAMRLSVSCRRDEDCLCEAGCPGVANGFDPTFGTWKPTCFKRGWNKCMCALQSTVPKTEDGCKYPTPHRTEIGSKEIDIYYAQDGTPPTKKHGFWLGH